MKNLFTILFSIILLISCNESNQESTHKVIIDNPLKNKENTILSNKIDSCPILVNTINDVSFVLGDDVLSFSKEYQNIIITLLKGFVEADKLYEKMKYLDKCPNIFLLKMSFNKNLKSYMNKEAELIKNSSRLPSKVRNKLINLIDILDKKILTGKSKKANLLIETTFYVLSVADYKMNKNVNITEKYIGKAKSM